MTARRTPASWISAALDRASGDWVLSIDADERLSPELKDEIRRAAEKSGAPFLDALDPPWLTSEMMQANLGGPNDKGQSVIADKIAAWLRTEVVAP